MPWNTFAMTEVGSRTIVDAARSDESADGGAIPERLDLFRIARGFVRLAHQLHIANLTHRDEFRRSSLSMLNNIAEGAHQSDEKAARRSFAVAREHACECAILLARFDDALPRLAELLSRIIWMLMQLAR